MTEKANTPESSQNVIFSDWIQQQAGIWEQAWKQAAQAWQAPLSASVPENDGSGRQPGPDEIGKAVLEFSQALSSLAGTPKPDVFQSAKSVPDMMLKMFQPLWTYSIKLQKQWAAMTGATATGEPESLAELVKQITRALSENQGEDFRRILNVPQLGLTRYYQERFNKAIEKATDFQSMLTEFVQLLMIPMEKSYYGIQEEIAKMEKEGKEAVSDSRGLYKLWIQKLEDHYMALLRSEDYIKILRETLNSLHDFRAARAEFFMDLLQDLPIPTNKEMDELYKDLHTLKKRIKELERKVKQDAKRK